MSRGLRGVLTVVSLGVLLASRGEAAGQMSPVAVAAPTGLSPEVASSAAPTGTPLPPLPPYRTQTFQVGSVSVVARSLDHFDWPMATPHVLYTITNTGATAITNALMSGTENGSPNSTPVQPRSLFLNPGESQTTSIEVGQSSGLDNFPSQSTNLTIRLTIDGQGVVDVNTTVTNWLRYLCTGACNPPPYPPGSTMTMSGQVVDESGNGIVATVQLGSHGTFLNDRIQTTVRADGTFSATVPKATSWVLRVVKTGYQSAFVFFDETRDYANVSVVLHSYVGPTLTYSPAVAKEYLNAFWQGTLSSDEQRVFLSPGMEAWTDAMTPYKSRQKVMLYTVDGQKVWDQPSGEDAKGSSLSGDGKWAVYAANPTRGLPGQAGLPARIVLLDTSDGHTVWTKPLTDFPVEYPDPPAGSLEVRLSTDGQHVVEGETYYLRGLSRSDGHLIWSRFTKGVVRSIRLSSDGTTFYAVSSARMLTRMSIADGSVLWTATSAGSFTHQTGLKESPDGSLVGMVGVEGDITMADARTGQILWTFITSEPGHFVGFSSDSKVFVVSTLYGTWGFSARTGDRLFAVGGSEGGSFATGSDYFVQANTPDSSGVYDTTGTLVSNLLTGLDWTTPNYYTSLITSDLNHLIFALREARNPSTPVLFFASLQDVTTTSAPRMSIDTPPNDATRGQSFTLAGWAVDRGALNGSGVDAIHVYAYPIVNGALGAGQFVGQATYGSARGDIGAAFGSHFTNSGYSLAASLSLGTYRLVAYARSTVTSTFNNAASVDVTISGPVSDPHMSLDGPANNAIIQQPFITGGWAVDLGAASGTGIDAVHVWAFPVVNGAVGAGQFVDAALLGGARPDVGAVFGAQFANAGFNFLMTGLNPGQYYVGVYVHSSVTGTFNQQQFALVTIAR